MATVPFHQDPTVVRRALASGLAAYLDSGRVRAALQLWVDGFEGRGNVQGALGRYCRDAAARFGMAGREAELQLKVFRALQTPAFELPDDPLASQPPGDPLPTEPAALATVPGALTDAPDQSPAGASASPSARLLMEFCTAVEAQVVRERVPGISAAYLRRAWIAHSRTLPPGARRAATAWWGGEVRALAGNWAGAGLTTKLINLVYVVLAQQLGPVLADRCFTAAVDHLEASADPVLRDIRQHL